MISSKSSYRLCIEGEKIEAAFLFQAGTVWPSLESVYNELKRDAEVSVRLFFDNNTTVEKSHSAYAEKFLIENKIDFEPITNFLLDDYIPHVVFVQFPYDAAFHVPELLSYAIRKKGSRVIYIPYGIEISDTPIARKDHFNSRVVENSWRIYTSSDGIYDEYKKYCRNRNAVRVTGSPKFDGIFYKDKYCISDDILNQAKGRSVILWKMHFPKTSYIEDRYRLITPEIEDYKAFSEYIETREDLFFVIMPHPKLIGSVVESDLNGNIEIIDEYHDILNRLSNYENVYVDTSVDYRPSLYGADAIIIDRSATMVEAVLLNKPVLIMQNGNYNEPMIKPVEELITAAGIGTNYEDMVGFVNDYKCFYESHKSAIENVVKKWFPYVDGKCEERIIRDIKESLKAERSVDNKTRVILYGIGEVASYYMKEQGWDKPERFEIVAVCDSSKTNDSFYGYKVIKPDEIVEYDFDFIVVMTEPHFYEIQMRLINELYISDKQVVRLDEFLTDGNRL